MPSHYLKQCWLVVIWIPWNKLSDIWVKMLRISLKKFENVAWKMFAILYQHRCVDGHVAINVIKLWLKTHRVHWTLIEIVSFSYHSNIYLVWYSIITSCGSFLTWFHRPTPHRLYFGRRVFEISGGNRYFCMSRIVLIVVLYCTNHVCWLYFRVFYAYTSSLWYLFDV